MRALPDGTWYCEECDRRFDSESVHVDRIEPEPRLPAKPKRRWVAHGDVLVLEDLS